MYLNLRRPSFFPPLSMSERGSKPRLAGSRGSSLCSRSHTFISQKPPPPYLPLHPTNEHIPGLVTSPGRVASVHLSSLTPYKVTCLQVGFSSFPKCASCHLLYQEGFPWQKRRALVLGSAMNTVMCVILCKALNTCGAWVSLPSPWG